MTDDDHSHPRPPHGRIGLILGSGGIRGGAHAGIISALYEFGLRPDVVVGASVGSLFGLALAAGWPPQRIHRLVLESKATATLELYRNRMRIDRNTLVGRLLADIGEDTRIEDLPTPFACMVLDWDTGEIVALRRGPALRAAQASISMPWIAKPVEIDGRRFMDGGLKGPTRARVAREMGADWVVAARLYGKQGGQRRFERYNRVGDTLLRWGYTPSGIPASLREHHRFFLRTFSYNFFAVDLAPEDSPDLEIWPRFRFVPVRSPLGQRLCLRLGERAARETLGALLSADGNQHPVTGEQSSIEQGSIDGPEGYEVVG